MSEVGIDRVFWKILHIVKYDINAERMFIDAVGSIASVMTMGVMGWFVWFCVSSFIPNNETISDKMERISHSERERETFVIRLSEKLGYKDNWQRMFHDLENGIFRIKGSLLDEFMTE